MPAVRSTLTQDERTQASEADLGGIPVGVAGWVPCGS
jgi:hypothetical protein